MEPGLVEGMSVTGRVPGHEVAEPAVFAITLGPASPHPPDTGGEQIDTFPWAPALTELHQLVIAQCAHGPRRSAS